MGGSSTDHEWLELIADLIAAPPGVLPDDVIASQLCATFDLTGCSFTDGGTNGWNAIRLWPETEQFGGRRADIVWWTRHRAVHLHPILRFYLHTRSCVLMQTADVPEEVVGRPLLDEWVDYGTSIDAVHQIALPMTVSPTRHRSFVMGRREPFRPAEVRRVRLLWRALAGVDRLIDVLEQGPAAADVRSELRLTAREVAVLGLLAHGLTAAAIGRRLAIAERTVHKHLANSYAKLRVGDRLSAVLRAQEIGLLPRGPQPDPHDRLSLQTTSVIHSPARCNTQNY